MKALLLILPAVVVLAGCSTANPKAYSVADEPTCLLTHETNGVSISVDAILDRPRSERYFSTDTLKMGIVPVFVRVENVSSPGSVLVEKGQFKIAVNAEAQADSPLPGDVKYKSTTGQVIGGVGLLALSSPLIIVGSAMISTADEIRHNFVDKEFRDQSLAPGRSTQGFVYCQLQDRKQPVRMVSIFIPVRNLQTDQQTSVEFLVQK